MQAPKLFFLVLLLLPALLWGQQPNTNQNKFRQLSEDLPTPNVYRNAAGAPGHQYWENRADYEMQITLDDDKQRIYGEETITYHNESPDPLTYLWLQLDQNMRAKNSDRQLTSTSSLSNRMTFDAVNRLFWDFDGGFKIDWVRDGNGRELPYTINKTMMRVDLPQTLEPGGSFTLQIKWWYNINDRKAIGGRSGYEYFSEDSNYLYTIAQFFPRMCVYNDIYGWQNKQFLGRGEFTLPFGDYKVSLTVPADHVVTATGELQNAKSVLTAAQRQRLEEAKTATDPVMIVSPEEALRNEKSRSSAQKTWVFEAKNVRDFAFASSRKFIWDAMGQKSGDRNVLCMSLYPKEGNPLWELYSTRVVAHTIRTYSKYTFDYPYPVAISVHTDRIGMEYPMICFNGGRPEPDGTYSERTKYGMISVIIHEVGHNYFPMIVNSDERQWTWMDEGLNSFLQYLSQQEWQPDYPSRRGPAYKIVDYMKGDKKMIAPIMTNSELIYQFGNNAYGKPATALNILRETILGRELFDHAFKTYSQRWMFRHPSPADFFRTMEDASGTDLDWFWRGWFYTNDHVDISVDDVRWFQINTEDPEIEMPLAKKIEESQPAYITDQRNREENLETLIEKDPRLADFYNKRDPYEINLLDRYYYNQFIEQLTEKELALLQSGLHFYEVSFSNKGGLVMPLILKFEFEDGSDSLLHIPAEIWRYNNDSITKVFYFDQELVRLTLDPYRETADIDTGNNYWPPRAQPTRFELFRQRRDETPNDMQIDQYIKKVESESREQQQGDSGSGGN